MVYTFTKDVFINLDVSNTKLLDKIWFSSRGKHSLFIRNEEEYQFIIKSNWYKGLRKSNQEDIDLQFVNSFNINKKVSKLVISSKNQDAYSLVEAIAILEKPLTIILEHIEYDKYFIDALFNNFSLGKKLNKYYAKGWLEFANGGGSNTPKVLKIMKNRFDKNKADFPKDSSVYVRSFVIIYSDKKFPSTEVVSEEKKKLFDSIKRDSHFHVTLKREMENYLPDEVFNTIQNNKKFVEAYLRLNSTQKDFFDIEKGFPRNKNFNSLDVNIRNLYDGVSDRDKETFRNEHIVFFKEERKKVNFKATYPKLFISDKISQANLKARAKSTDENELTAILQKINNLL